MIVLQPLPYFVRYSGDDWAGSQAFAFTLFSVSPTFDDDGNIATPGTPIDITGYQASGSISYRQRLPTGPQAITAGIPQSLTGSLTDPTHGSFELTLARGMTIYPRQNLYNQGDCALLDLRVILTDPSGNLGTIGIAPVYVF